MQVRLVQCLRSVPHIFMICFVVTSIYCHLESTSHLPVGENVGYGTAKKTVQRCLVTGGISQMSVSQIDVKCVIWSFCICFPNYDRFVPLEDSRCICAPEN